VINATLLTQRFGYLVVRSIIRSIRTNVNLKFLTNRRKKSAFGFGKMPKSIRIHRRAAEKSRGSISCICRKSGASVWLKALFRNLRESTAAVLKEFFTVSGGERKRHWKKIALPIHKNFLKFSGKRQAAKRSY